MQEKKATRRLLDGPEILNTYINTISHYFSHLPRWVARIHDPRNHNLITYPTIHMFFMGLILFLGRLETRRQLTFSLNTLLFVQNFNTICGTKLERTAHHDTVEYF